MLLQMGLAPSDFPSLRAATQVGVAHHDPTAIPS